MSETIKIIVTAVVPKMSAAGKKYQSVIFNGTESGVVFADGGDFQPFVGQTIDVQKEISTKDGKSIILRLPGMERTDAAKKPFTPYQKSDPIFELRKAAIVIALDACKIDKFTPENLVKYTKQAEKYLKDGEI